MHDVPVPTARRFKHPIFLSLDLPFLNSDATGVSPEMSGRWLLQLEKLVVQKLEQAFAQRDLQETVYVENLPATNASLQGEIVGR